MDVGLPLGSVDISFSQRGFHVFYRSYNGTQTLLFITKLILITHLSILLQSIRITSNKNRVKKSFFLAELSDDEIFSQHIRSNLGLFYTLLTSTVPVLERIIANQMHFPVIFNQLLFNPFPVEFGRIYLKALYQKTPISQLALRVKRVSFLILMLIGLSSFVSESRLCYVLSYRLVFSFFHCLSNTAFHNCYCSCPFFRLGI